MNILICSACGCHSSSPVTSCLLGIPERKPGLAWKLAADGEKEEREREGGQIHVLSVFVSQVKILNHCNGRIKIFENHMDR